MKTLPLRWEDIDVVSGKGKKKKEAVALDNNNNKIIRKLKQKQ